MKYASVALGVWLYCPECGLAMLYVTTPRAPDFEMVASCGACQLVCTVQLPRVPVLKFSRAALAQKDTTA